tara:strand:+ start:1005 stop:1922 length:918 start_codon:yes stop_codon:yes gene_type:complete
MLLQRFPTNYLIVEGPDLSGKTTFYNHLHKKSDYCWNIQDRSNLSMCVHAHQYERDILQHKLNFDIELLNLNNRFIIMLPSLNTLVERYYKRGDEIQTLDQVKALHEIFKLHVNQLKNFPHVFVVSEDDLNKNVEKVYNCIKEMEAANLQEISGIIQKFALNSPGFEATPLNITLYDSGTFTEACESIMEYLPEKEYYNRVLTGIIEKIQNECAGNNSYNLPQSVYSRRFIYTNDSCLSFIHATYRNNLLDMHFVARSSEVSKTFPYDLKFLFYLSKRVYNELKLQPTKDIVRMRFNLNSGHILL